MTIADLVNGIIYATPIWPFVASFVGAGLVADGEFNYGPTALIAGIGVKLLARGVSAHLFAKGNQRANIHAINNQTITSVHNNMKASAISATLGVTAMGMTTIAWGAYHRDLREIRKGALNFAVGGIGTYLVANMSAAKASAITTTAMSSYLLSEGVKDLANRKWVKGAVRLLCGGSTAAYAAGMAYLSVFPESVSSKLVPRG